VQLYYTYGFFYFVNKQLIYQKTRIKLDITWRTYKQLYAKYKQLYAKYKQLYAKYKQLYAKYKQLYAKYKQLYAKYKQLYAKYKQSALRKRKKQQDGEYIWWESDVSERLTLRAECILRNGMEQVLGHQTVECNNNNKCWNLHCGNTYIVI